MNEEGSPSKRIEIIDALRGFALAGILYAHMIIWYTGAALPENTYEKYDGFLNYVSMAIFGAFVFGKFFSVFSFLFGLSFYLHLHKHQNEHSYIKVYAWRLFLLLIIGMVHHIIWRGDILVIYAILGYILLIIRFFNDKLILIIATALIINLPVNLVNTVDQITGPIEDLSFPMQEKARKYYHVVQTYSFWETLKANWQAWPAKIKYQIESGRLTMTLGYFMLGLYAGKKGWFFNLKSKLLNYRYWNKRLGILLVFLLSVGLMLVLLDKVHFPEVAVDDDIKWFASFLFDFYNAALTLFFITGAALLYFKKKFKPALDSLALMGRMALTIYLMQTFFGLFLFYDFGLGLFDVTPPVLNVLLFLLVLFIQIKLSSLWLQRYKRGPVEWLWRSLTQLQVIGNKK